MYSISVNNIHKNKCLWISECLGIAIQAESMDITMSWKYVFKV